MTLFKQIAMIMSVFLLFVLLSIVTFNVNAAQKYAQEEMANNAQNTASFLSLSLAQAKGNTAEMSAMINAIFDSGYFMKITLSDENGVLLFERTKSEDEASTPDWFKSLFPIDSPSASATVSSGWTPIGNISVIPAKENTQHQLYRNSIEILQSFAIIALVSFALLHLVLRLVLSSLTRVKEQAEAVSDNSFIINTAIPKTLEFKEVTLAMNKMVNKVKEIFEKEAASIQEYHKLLYTDSLTGLYNKVYFERKFNELLHSQEADSHGLLLGLYLEGVQEANKKLGHEKVDQIINDIAQKAKSFAQDHEDVICSRVDGTKIILIFPQALMDDIKEIAEALLTFGLVHFEKESLADYESSIRLAMLSYTAKDKVETILSQLNKALMHGEKNSITNLMSEEPFNGVLDRKVIENRIKEHAIALATQNVYDDHDNILHSEAYVRLFDDKKVMHEAGAFIPLIHQMRLDTRLDQSVINFILNENSLEGRDIAVNISLAFLKDKAMHQWLKERLAGSNIQTKLHFEISNHNVLGAITDAVAFSTLVKESGHHFGIDRFSIEEQANLNYLQMIKPEYLKIDSTYLHDMIKGDQGQLNPALQILIEGLDITIIASNIEKMQIKEELSAVGIKHFQGSLLSQPKLI